MAGAAGGVEGEHFFGGEGGCVIVHLRVLAEFEVVFDVELELVDFQAGKIVDELEEGFEGGDFAAGAIVVDAAVGEVGMIVDSEARQFEGFFAGGVGGLTEDLGESLEGVKGAGRRAGLDVDAGFADDETIGLLVGEGFIDVGAEFMGGGDGFR